MLSADQIDALPSGVMDVFEEFIQSVINDIARRLVKMGNVTATASWQMQRINETGAIYENAIRELARMTGKSERELVAMFERAGVQTMRYDDSIYRAAGLKPLPLNLSPAMAQVLAAGLKKTNGIMRNMTMTTALQAQQSFIKAADLAYMQVTSGAMDYNSAIRAAVKKMAGDGLTTVDYLSGRVDSADVAMRRAVLTGVTQTASQLQETRADELGVDLVQTSAHAGARNRGTGPGNHESWQGRIFSRSGTHPKYPDFVKETGYGTITGLGGVNCRHSFYPYFEGISENAYSRQDLRKLEGQKRTVDGDRVPMYDASQRQREIERGIRFWKRQAGALDAAGLDHAAETAKVKEWQATMRRFIDESRLLRQSEREQI